MVNTVYRLVQPRRFEIEFTSLDLSGQEVIVKPLYLSICNADQRYYQGTRDAAVLKNKLPMALIHEGVGAVVYDPSGEFKPGDTVVMIPNLPAERSEVAAENYLRSSRFCSSNCDGFMREYVNLPADRLVRLPDGMNLEVAAFTELVSVCYHSLTRFSRFAHSTRDTIGVWGDGNVSYIISLLLKKLYPESKVYVFGIVPKKLADFTFADAVFLTTEIDGSVSIDHAFECVGGNGSQVAVNQIIDVIKPEGTISLMGVSEYPVPLNTRMILEKGLRLFGSSRSGRSDFASVVKLYAQDPEFVEYLSAVLYKVSPVNTVKQMTAAFELDSNKAFGKTIMKWQPELLGM